METDRQGTQPALPSTNRFLLPQSLGAARESLRLRNSMLRERTPSHVFTEILRRCSGRGRDDFVSRLVAGTASFTIYDQATAPLSRSGTPRCLALGMRSLCADSHPWFQYSTLLGSLSRDDGRNSCFVFTAAMEAALFYCSMRCRFPWTRKNRKSLQQSSTADKL